MPSMAPASITAWITAAPARIRSARAGLIPGTLARSDDGRPASSSTSASSASRVSTNPCTPSDGRPAACCAAAARLRTVPPIPAIRPPSQSASSQLRRHVRAQGLELLARRLLPGEEVLGHAHGAQGPGAQLVRAPVADEDELHAAAAEVEHHAVGERGGVHGRQVAVARLLLDREHPHLQPRPLARAREEVGAVGGVADRAGGHRAHVVEAGGPAEVGVEVQRAQRALHRVGLELARGVQARPDAHGLVDLVDPLPPAVRREDDEPEGVRAEVDYRGAARLLGHPA